MNTTIKIMMISTIMIIAVTTKAEASNHSTGFGLQYGGVIGYQISKTTEQHNFRAALGLVGASLGYDYFISESFSLGTTYTATLRNVTSLNLNYYASGYSKEGWVVGIDIAHMSEEKQSGSGFFNLRSDEEKNTVWISIGYRF